MLRPSPAAGLLMLSFFCPAGRAEEPQPKPPEGLLLPSFSLFPSLVRKQGSELPTRLDLEPKRLLHQPGDPDSIFTLGSPTPQGEVRFQAAIEVNEVFLRAMTPDVRIDPSDTKFRASGDYRSLDSHGRPYQLRLGAKLVW